MEDEKLNLVDEARSIGELLDDPANRLVLDALAQVIGFIRLDEQ